MSMADNTYGDGDDSVQETSSSSGNSAGSVSTVISYTKDWGRNGLLNVTYSVKLKTAAVGAIVLLTGAGQSKSLGAIPSGGAGTLFQGGYYFSEKHRAFLEFEVVSGANSNRHQFEVLSAQFTP
ncbi:hypothetical protein [Pseudomonas helvetica]|uniref:hypothetical protein n=1 Tax=Pseudomonas helvetica TaxID=3136738 RepID=UPI0032648153